MKTALLLIPFLMLAQTQIPPSSVPWNQVNVSGCGAISTSGTQLNVNQIVYPVQPSLPQLAKPKPPLAVSMAGPFSPKKLTASAIALIQLTPQCWPVELQSNAWSVINTYCIRCHGYDAPWYDSAGMTIPEPPDSLLAFALARSKLVDLRSYSSMLQGAGSGPVIVPGHSELSLIYTSAATGLLSADQISGSGLSYPVSMPPFYPLQPTEVLAIQMWIDAGAPNFVTGP